MAILACPPIMDCKQLLCANKMIRYCWQHTVCVLKNSWYEHEEKAQTGVVYMVVFYPNKSNWWCDSMNVWIWGHDKI